jgi:hypothetical protein
MSDSFEKWAADKTFLLKASEGDGYINFKEMALEAWQAALQSGEPVVDVNQQLLNDIINMMIAVKGAIRLGCYGEAYEYLNAAIAAAQGRNNEPISNLLG